MTQDYEFITECVHSTGEAIREMVDQAREITWQTFYRHVSRAEVRRVFPFYEGCSLTIERDYAVHTYRSRYHSQPCYFIVHSAIEYIFQRPQQSNNGEER